MAEYRPRHATLRPPDGSGSSSTGHGSIASVFPGTAERVRLLGIVFLVGYGLNFIQWQLLPWLIGGWFSIEHCFREPIMLSFSVLVILAARRLPPRRALLSACALQLCAVFDVTTIAPSAAVEFDLTQQGAAVGIPWSCVMISVFPLLLPASRRLHTIMALAALLILPIWHGLMTALGGPVVSNDLFLGWLFPTMICVALAIVCGHLVDATAREVAQARRELTRLGSYQLVERIGVGGMGEVWLGQHHMLARPAAIKVINAERIAAEGRKVEVVLERFEREAQAIAGLRSGHTVEIYDYGRTDDGAFFYVMELLDGIDLEELIADHGPQPCARVLRLWRQMCLSLAEAHEQGLVHRDLKPANMYICRQGCELDVVKVLDFGLVLRQTIKGSGEARLTEQRTVYGTPAFMAPEQALGEEDVDHRADLYALGCVIYYLLVGRPPFEETTAMKIMIAHVRKDPEPPSARGIHLPEAMEALLLECLAKDRERRPADAWAILSRLDALSCEDRWGDEERRAWWAQLAATRFTKALACMPTSEGTVVSAEQQTETSGAVALSGN